MQHQSFETVIKNGYIKVPEQYSEFYNKKVVVEILKKVNPTQKKMESFYTERNSLCLLFYTDYDNYC